MPGSSPLTRGKRSYGEAGSTWDGLIPAHAGKTETPSADARLSKAHPRSRGENNWTRPPCPTRSGSSPLTRGKHRPTGNPRGNQGLIPAHAGKTCGSGGRARSMRAHPRSRGENAFVVAYNKSETGSSPLTRGKLTSPDEQLIKLGLIPAHAGKTPWWHLH